MASAAKGFRCGKERGDELKVGAQIDECSILKGCSKRLTEADKAIVEQALKSTLLKFADIGLMVGVTRERIRQIALQMGDTGRDRSSKRIGERHWKATAGLPFVIRATEMGLEVAPISRTRFMVNGKFTIIAVACNGRGPGGAYTSIRRPTVEAEVFVWDLRDGHFLILPVDQANFRQTLFAKEMKHGNGRSCGQGTYSTQHHWRGYIDAWHVFGSKDSGASATGECSPEEAVSLG